VLSLTGHEIRNPLGVVVGYLRMVLSERSGPLEPFQRKALEEALNASARIKEVADQLSALRKLEDEETQLQKIRLELGALLKDAIDAASSLPDRTVDVELDCGPDEIHALGDPEQLRSAIASIIFAIRREIVHSDRLIVRQRLVAQDMGQVAWIVIADSDRIDELAKPTTDGLVTFDEWRGGVQLSLPIARRVLNAHGGQLWTRLVEQEEGLEPLRAGAVIALPID
jgi:signal transduction histidine kinase